MKLKAKIIMLSGLATLVMVSCGNKTGSKGDQTGLGEATSEQTDNNVVSTPQSDVDILKHYAWTDGSVIYHIKADGVSTADNVCRYEFIGGTMHEGGYGLCIEDSEGYWISVGKDDDKFYQLADCSVKLSPKHDALIFSDAASGEMVTVLVAVEPTATADDITSYKPYFERDIVAYMLDGKFQTAEGKTVEFNPDSFKAEGSLFGGKTFKIGSTFDTPMPVLLIDGKAYYIEKVYGALNLLSLSDFSDESFGYNTDGDCIDLQRTDDNFWPELTQRVLSKAEILYYAGYNPDGPYSDEDIQLRMQFRNDMYTTMVNSIYARHGLKFQDEEAERTFSGMSWYKPQHDNVELSETENINIQLINSLTARIFD